VRCRGALVFTLGDLPFAPAAIADYDALSMCRAW